MIRRGTEDKRVTNILTTFRELELHRTPSAGSLSHVLSSPPNLPHPPPPQESEMTEDTTSAAAVAAAVVASTETAATAEGGVVELLEEPVEEMVSVRE